jgi:hypothetical protein
MKQFETRVLSLGLLLAVGDDEMTTHSSASPSVRDIGGLEEGRFLRVSGRHE